MKFKVGGIPYKVEEAGGIDSEYLGMCEYATQQILIDKRLPPQRKAQVIAHELTHAILFEAGYDEQDEDMVNRIGIVMAQFLTQNDFTALKEMMK